MADSRHRPARAARPGPVRLGAARRRLINGVGLGVWATGAAWLFLHDFVLTQGAFGPEHSPGEPWLMKAHGALAFLALWTGGLLWGVHVVEAWRQRRRRVSGGVTVGVLVLLIVTGYLLYYAGDEGPRAWISVIHWAIGLAAPVSYLVHRLSKRTASPVRPSR